MSSLPRLPHLFFIALFSLLTACGGGSNAASDNGIAPRTNAGPTTPSPRQSPTPTTTPHVNQAPRLQSLSNQQLDAGSGTKQINLFASDSDSSTVTFSATKTNGADLPDFIYIENNGAKSGKLIIEGNEAEAGTYRTKVTATDPEGATSSKSIVITVIAPTQKTVKILPLGDSITQARYDQLSYRYPLWKRLIDADIDFDFIGSQDQTYDGYRGWATYNGNRFDQDHEGYSGMTADWVLYNADFHYDNPADIALIHLGTNDLLWTGDSGEYIRGDITNIINNLRNTNPKIKILVAKILPFDDADNRYYDYISGIDELASNMSQTNSPVIVVDMTDIYDLYDGIHPDVNGEEKMAQRWFDAMINNGLL